MTCHGFRAERDHAKWVCIILSFSFVPDSGSSESCLMEEVLSQVLRSKTFPEQRIRPCHPPGLFSPHALYINPKASVWGILPCHAEDGDTQGVLWANLGMYLITLSPRFYDRAVSNYVQTDSQVGHCFRLWLLICQCAFKVHASYQRGQQQTLKLHGCGYKQSLPTLALNQNKICAEA